MAKPIEKTKSGLKLRTNSAPKALTIRIKGKKYVLPIEVRTIESDDYIFVHIPPAAEIFAIGNDGLKTVTSNEEAETAVVSFRKARKKPSSRGGRTPAMPAELASLLSKIPAGYKLGYDATGNPRLVKTRKRGK